jgi:hypothetical protein
MNDSKTLLALVLSLSCLGLACEPKQSTVEPDAAASEPAPAPAAEEPAPEEPADDAAAPNKCVADGGTCTNKTATVACARFEEGPEWGCAEANTGCCFQ